jgi:streptogramin lyase
VWLPSDATGSVVRVSVRTNQVTGIVQVGTPDSGGGDPLALAADGPQLWTIRDLAHEVDRLNPLTGKVVERVRIGENLTDLTVANGIVWATSDQTDDVLRIDPRLPRK